MQIGRTSLTVVLFAAVCACSKKPAAPAPARHGQTVDAAGLQLFVDCRGEGGPTVVFESGLGLDGTVWDRARAALTTRTCSYDRAGLGRSGPARSRHGPRQMADELFALLERTEEPGPYVLVAHSMGAAIDRWF